MRLTELQKQLCDALQDGLPICARPFADLAAYLNSDEQTVLEEIRQLKVTGIVRRIGPFVNYRTLGMAGTLVTAHVPQEEIHEVGHAVSALPGVSHNYLRKHHYNLWFTLQAESNAHIEHTLAKLSQRFGIDFHSLPVERVFKLEVRFDIEAAGQEGLQEAVGLPSEEVVELSRMEKRILSKLQAEVQVTSKPFAGVSGEGLSEKEALGIIAGLIDKGVIRRIAAVLDHRKLGFVANVMFCCKLAHNRIVEAGRRLAGFRIVSHCYQRRTFEGWPYNLYAMMHGRTMDEIQHVVSSFTETENIDSFQLLPTEEELKKKPVRHPFL
ncbi:MAG: siroheme decarboxylase subunit beta [Planctomycetota bacterium]|jgi:DNA-binding Lrp family transcriptional regulator